VLEHVFASTSQVDQDQLVKGKDISGGFMFQFAPDLGGTHAADVFGLSKEPSRKIHVCRDDGIGPFMIFSTTLNSCHFD
jgi:hypothetical protein